MARRVEQPPLRKLDQVATYRRMWTGRVWWGFIVVGGAGLAALVPTLAWLYAHHLSLTGYLRQLLGPVLGLLVAATFWLATQVVKSVPHLGLLMRMLGQAERRDASLEEKVTQAATVKDAAALQELILGVAEHLRRQDEVQRRQEEALQRQGVVLQELAERERSGRHEAPPEPAPVVTWQPAPAGSHAAALWLPPEQPPLPEEPEATPPAGWHPSWGPNRPATGQFDAIFQAQPGDGDDPSLPDYLRPRS